MDVYLIGHDRDDLGIKVRGAKGGGAGDTGAPQLRDVEVKGLVMVDWGVMITGPFAGPVEIWSRWSFPRLDLGMTRRCAVSKNRWMRRFDTTGVHPLEIPLGPDEQHLEGSRRRCPLLRGCNVEMTEVELEDGQRWSSLGFEAFGDLTTVTDNPRMVARTLTHRGPVPELNGGRILSYPRWIGRYVARSAPV